MHASPIEIRRLSNARKRSVGWMDHSGPDPPARPVTQACSSDLRPESSTQGNRKSVTFCFDCLMAVTIQIVHPAGFRVAQRPILSQRQSNLNAANLTF